MRIPTHPLTLLANYKATRSAYGDVNEALT